MLASIDQLQFDFAEPALRLLCSMGIAVCTESMFPEDSLELLRQAEIAMYQAKYFG